jgi:hypothetical protein
MKNKVVLGLLFLTLAFVFDLFPVATFAQSACTMAGTKGKYGFVGNGSVPQQLPNHGGVQWDPTSEVGIVTFDGNGNVSMTARIQYHGNTATHAGSGTYEIKDDCTGGATFKDQNGNVVFNWSFVITSSGTAIETIEVVSANGNRPMFSITFSQHKF